MSTSSLLTTGTVQQLEHLLENLACIAREQGTLEPLLPFLLWLKGRPYSLEEYMPFKVIFRLDIPRRVLLKTGRQVGKTTSVAALTVIRAAAIPYHQIMVVLPLKSQSTNVSDAYYKQFILGSPIKELLMDPNCKKATLYKDFKNGSRIVFRYAGDDASGTRSYSNDLLVIDEFQDFDITMLPVIQETLSASSWRQQLYTGTPLNFENPIEWSWKQTSQHEWLIKCEHCDFWNIPSLEHHLEQMIGPVRDDISPEAPGTICARCGKPINPRLGQWVPANREAVGFYHGYHIPQIIMPMHFADKDRWRELLDKQRNWTRASFVREVLGESFEEGDALITDDELTEAANLGSLSFDLIEMRRPEYMDTVLAIDWGGGGTEGKSLTTIVFAGLTFDYRLEIPWGKRLDPKDPVEEADEIIGLIRQTRPNHIVHDFTGGIGSLRETILLNRGVSPDSIIPMYLVATTTNYMVMPVVAPHRTRLHYKVDRTRMLQHTIGSIKLKTVRFFNRNSDIQNLISDFLNLIEDRQSTISGREVYRIIKRKHTTDDFAIAVGLAAAYLWQLYDAWPQFVASEY